MTVITTYKWATLPVTSWKEAFFARQLQFQSCTGSPPVATSISGATWVSTYTRRVLILPILSSSSPVIPCSPPLRSFRKLLVSFALRCKVPTVSTGAPSDDSKRSLPFWVAAVVHGADLSEIVILIFV